MGGYRVFFWVLSAHCMLFAKMLPAFLETPCGSQTPTLSEPQLPVVAFSCLEAGGFQECGINITREVFQAWLKDPEFVPQHHGGWVAESVAGGKFHSNDGLVVLVRGIWIRSKSWKKQKLTSPTSNSL